MNPCALDQQISEQLAQANIDRANRLSARPSRAPAFALIDDEPPASPVLANVTREATLEPAAPPAAAAKPSQLLEALGWAVFAFLAVLAAHYGGR